MIDKGTLRALARLGGFGVLTVCSSLALSQTASLRIVTPTSGYRMLIDRGLLITFAPVKGAKQYECTIDQGKSHWSEIVSGGSTGCSADIPTSRKKFKLGQARFSVRAEMSNGWSPPTVTEVILVTDEAQLTGPLPPMKAVPVEQPAPQPVAQPMPRPVPQPMPQPVPRPVAQPMPQPVPRPIAQPVPQPVPRPIAQPVAQPVAQRVPPGLPNIGTPAAPAPGMAEWNQVYTVDLDHNPTIDIGFVCPAKKDNEAFQREGNRMAFMVRYSRGYKDGQPDVIDLGIVKFAIRPPKGKADGGWFDERYQLPAPITKWDGKTTREIHIYGSFGMAAYRDGEGHEGDITVEYGDADPNDTASAGRSGGSCFSHLAGSDFGRHYFGGGGGGSRNHGAAPAACNKAPVGAPCKVRDDCCSKKCYPNPYGGHGKLCAAH